MKSMYIIIFWVKRKKNERVELFLRNVCSTFVVNFEWLHHLKKKKEIIKKKINKNHFRKWYPCIFVYTRYMKICGLHV